jgi:hypothetical protein
MSATAISNRISFAPPPEAIQASQSALDVNAKAGAKLKQPGAATISEGLSTRFVGQGRPGKVAPPPASGPTASATSAG